jgi:hypothetical protein
MKKIFTFFIAALAAVTLSAEPVQQDITLNAEDWWGWDSSKENVGDNLVGTITAQWGAIATSFGAQDWSSWEKLVVVLDNIDGCVGEWWYLKAELRNPNYEYPASVTMSGELGLEGHNPAETNYLVVDLKNVSVGFDITQVDALVLQSQATGSFTVSRVFLEKEGDEQAIENVNVRNNGIRYNILGQPVDEDYKGVVITNGQKTIVR